MTRWTSKVFIERFCRGKLGRKSQYGKYYVIDADSCKILCCKNEEIVAVYMGPDFTIFNGTGLSRDVAGIAEFSMHIKEDESITESGLIDCDNSIMKSVLFQIGHKQYLLEPEWATKDIVTHKEYMKRNNNDICLSLNRRYGTRNDGAIIKILNKKCNSINEARESLVPQDILNNIEESFIFNNYWFVPDYTYTRRSLSLQEKRILEQPPMPWHFNMQNVLSKEIESAIFNTSITSEYISCAENILAFINAKHAYYCSLKMYEISEEKDFKSFSILPSNSNDGILPSEDGNFFVKGSIRLKNIHGYESIAEQYKRPPIKELNVWHKMIREF